MIQICIEKYGIMNYFHQTRVKSCQTSRCTSDKNILYALGVSFLTKKYERYVIRFDR